MDEEKPLNMMLVYSADTIYIYEVLNASSSHLPEVGLDLRCKYRMHSTIQSVNYFTSSEENKTIFLACFDDLRVATLSFNYGQSAIETVALHRLSTRDTMTLLSASSYKPSKPILRVDVSRTPSRRWSWIRSPPRFLPLLSAPHEKNGSPACSRWTKCLGWGYHYPEGVGVSQSVLWRPPSFIAILCASILELCHYNT